VEVNINAQIGGCQFPAWAQQWQVAPGSQPRLPLISLIIDHYAFQYSVFNSFFLAVHFYLEDLGWLKLFPFPCPIRNSICQEGAGDIWAFWEAELQGSMQRVSENSNCRLPLNLITDRLWCVGRSMSFCKQWHLSEQKYRPLTPLLIQPSSIAPATPAFNAAFDRVVVTGSSLE
jgi:hypothetical protein